MIRWFLAGFFFTVTYLSGGLVHASHAPGHTCLPLLQMVRTLYSHHTETVRAQMFDLRGTTVHVFATDDGSSYTITTTNSRGITCVQSWGYGYERLSLPPPPPKGDST